MANVYPPSPAPSACDSLADIEDLDAFLEAQGQLSHWPTPPPAEKDEDPVIVEAWESEDEETWKLAAAFTNLTKGNLMLWLRDLEDITDILLRARVSPAVLALAFNILRAVSPREEEAPDNFPLPTLAVIAALHLASAFDGDKPPRSEYWAQYVCRGPWTAWQVDATVLDFLSTPGVRMLTLSSHDAIDATMRELCDIAQGEADPARVADVPEREEKEGARPEPPPPLNLEIDVGRTHWVNGTFTPAETPVAEDGPWLRLL